MIATVSVIKKAYVESVLTINMVLIVIKHVLKIVKQGFVKEALVIVKIVRKVIWEKNVIKPVRNTVSIAVKTVTNAKAVLINGMVLNVVIIAPPVVVKTGPVILNQVCVMGVLLDIMGKNALRNVVKIVPGTKLFVIRAPGTVKRVKLVGMD